MYPFILKNIHNWTGLAVFLCSILGQSARSTMFANKKVIKVEDFNT